MKYELKTLINEDFLFLGCAPTYSLLVDSEHAMVLTLVVDKVEDKFNYESLKCIYEQSLQKNRSLHP